MASSSRKAFLAELAELAAALRARIEAEVTGLDPDPAQCQIRRKSAQASYEYFVRTYFPHYIRSPHQSEMHRYLFMRLPQIVDSEEGEHDAIAAPRGEAKSTLVTQLFVLWCIVTGRKKFAVIVMDSIDQAYPMLEAIKAELEFNPRLKMDFPAECGAGRVWQAGTIVTATNAKVQVAGSGKKLRGLRHGPYRPDLAVLDDIENDEQVRSAEQRDKLHGWLTKTVLPMGEAGAKFDVVYIGTILHYDSVLSRTLANKMWRTARFKAVLRWPDRMDLWDRWEEQLRNEGEEAADAFYQAHAAAMERGAQCSWAARPMLALMKIRARDGHDVFDSEYQNDPVAGDNAPFANAISYWAELPEGLVMFGAVDPSLGKAGARRDPSAILVGGIDRRSGVLYVLEAQIKRRLPDRIIEDVIAMQRKWRCVLWVVETVQFQEFLHSELVKRSAAAGCPVPARGVKPTADKLLRIESLQPHVKNKLIRLHADQGTLIDQLRHFPKADHDDGPDALHMLWTAATTATAGGEGFHSVGRRARRGDSGYEYDRGSRRMF